jgi:hypothetical protein
MPTKSRLFAWAAAAGGVLVLLGCGGGGGSPATSAAAFDKSLDGLCAADWAVSRSLPSLQASQHLTVAQLQAKSAAAAAAFKDGEARLTPPANLAGPLHTLQQDAAKVPASQTTPDAAWVTAMITYERKLAGDYTALGAAGCAADEAQSLTGLEELASLQPSPSPS